MSLATQLRRGVLALPLLLMFAILAVAAARVPSSPLVRVEPATLPAQVCLAEPAHAPALWLAQTPADLDSPGRWRQSCRT
jgi:hypothetical protein